MPPERDPYLDFPEDPEERAKAKSMMPSEGELFSDLEERLDQPYSAQELADQVQAQHETQDIMARLADQSEQEATNKELVRLWDHLSAIYEKLRLRVESLKRGPQPEIGLRLQIVLSMEWETLQKGIKALTPKHPRVVDEHWPENQKRLLVIMQHVEEVFSELEKQIDDIGKGQE